MLYYVHGMKLISIKSFLLQGEKHMNYETFFEELMERVFDSPVFNEAEAELTLHLKGEVASSIVRDTFIKSFENSRKPSSIKDAKKVLKKIIKRIKKTLKKLLTT